MKTNTSTQTNDINTYERLVGNANINDDVLNDHDHDHVLLLLVHYEGLNMFP
jgi:hypothetical protein